LSFPHNNYSDDSAKLFSDLAKFLDISAKSFFSCDKNSTDNFLNNYHSLINNSEI